MKIKIAGLGCIILLLVSYPLAVAQSQSPAGSHWTYSGEEGPEHWGSIDPKYAVCSIGREQSPIDITAATKTDLPALKFDYHSAPLKIVDNGHTIMVTYAPGSTLQVGDKVYELKQFHFHHPSEERIHGQQSDMVIHLVHQDSAGHIAVVAVLLKAGDTNSALGVLWSHLPKEKNQPLSLPAISINAKDLLPSTLDYYTYTGSLTTPPCTEDVRWFVLKEKVKVSPEQVQIFSKLYPDNARPVQPLDGRAVLENGK